MFTSLSETLAETGLAAEINESGRYDAIRPKLARLDRTTQRREMKKLAAATDFVVGSVAAITEHGQIRVASGSGSQLGHYAYEAGKVILVAGVQKIVRDAAEGLRRIEEYSLPLENERMRKALAAGGDPKLNPMALTTTPPARSVGEGTRPVGPICPALRRGGSQTAPRLVQGGTMGFNLHYLTDVLVLF